MTMTPEPYDAPKKRSGFRVFMYVFVSLLGLLTLTCGAGIYYLTQTEKGQQIFEAFRETTNLAEKFPEKFVELKQKIIQHDAAVLAEGPDWWKDG